MNAPSLLRDQPGHGDSKLCDVVAEKTAGEKFREEFVTKASPGQKIMSQEAIDAADRANKENGGKGKVTTCIAYAGDFYNENAKGPDGKAPKKKFLGPNAYQEINPQAPHPPGRDGKPDPNQPVPTLKNDLPAGSWRAATPGLPEEPKPGDLLWLGCAEPTPVGEGAARVVAQKGWFAHIDILRAIQPAADPKQGEIWTTVDGGGTVSTAGTHTFDKQTLVLKAATGDRLLKGWFDVEKMAGYV